MNIAVSILKSKLDEKNTIEAINNTDAEFLHLDVMDGKFVEEITPKREYLQNSLKPIQVHLMVSNPFNYINKYAIKNAESIIFHVELDEDIDSLLSYIRNVGYKCGLAINPETDVSKLWPYIEKLDYVLVLTVKPGRGGQKMLDEPLSKIQTLIKLRTEKELSFKIIVDGGVNDETVSKVKMADIIVSGSYICSSDDYQEQIDKLRL